MVLGLKDLGSRIIGAQEIVFSYTHGENSHP
jgi:hypothetical protein